MQNVTARAWPDRTLMPSCGADRGVLEQPVSDARVGGVVNFWRLSSIQWEAPPGPPTPSPILFISASGEGS